MAQRTYFPMPNFDYPPDDLVLLGQIITSRETPFRALASPLEPLPRVQQSHKTDWRNEVHQTQRGSVGFWVQFLASVVGLGADVSVSWLSENEDCLQFKRLDTSFFQPDDEYVRNSVLGRGREAVVRYVKKNPRKPVYMITGVKIARGARHVRKMRSKPGVEAKIGASAAPFTGVPVEGGPMGSFEKETGETVQFAGSSDFVYAYRLRRIIVALRTGKVSGGDFVTGARVYTFGENGEEATPERREDSAGDPREEEIDNIFLAEDDFGADGYIPHEAPFVDITEDDDGAPCRLILPGD